MVLAFGRGRSGVDGIVVIVADTLPGRCRRRRGDALPETTAVDATLIPPAPRPHRAYATALRRLDAWLAGRDLDDSRLAAYLAALFEAAIRIRNLAAIFATADRPRGSGRGLESAERAAVDRVIAGLLFMGGLRRSSGGT